MNVLSVTDLHKAFGPRVLMDGVSLGVDAGDRIGLIGDNGTGKSTLLKIIAGREAADGGVVAIRQGLRVGVLDQVPTLPPDATVRAHLSEVFADVAEAIARYEEAAAALDPEAERWLDAIERRGGWDWSYRVSRIASRLALDDLLDRPLGTLSGGQGKRVALARLILSAPDVVLLDEPTNHLDADTVEWIEQWIGDSSATFIVVTHDRYFLERVVTRMAELRDAALRVYQGSYSDYLAARAEEEALQARTAKRRLSMYKTELAWAKRSPKARTTKAQARLDRVDALADDVERLTPERRVADFDAGQGPRLGKTVLELVHVAKAYDPDEPLIEGLTLMLRKGDRYGIIGPNGSGKTTLVRLALGELAPDAGVVNVGSHTRFAYFDQQRASLLDPALTVKETVCPQGDTVFVGGKPRHFASWLDNFAFPTAFHRQRVEALSGGERNRLALARFLLEEANVLVLDEPTNDLDLMTMHVLEEALRTFDGCVLVVSHDRYFLDRIATGTIAFERDPELFPEASRPHVVQGGYTSYRGLRDLRERERRERSRAAATAPTTSGRAPSRAPAKEASKGPSGGGLSWAEERELERLEPAIEADEAAMVELEGALADPTAWQGAAERGQALERDRQALAAKIEARYARWEDLVERRGP